MRVYSFIAPTVVKSFSTDVKTFFNYLEQTQNYPASQQNLIGEFCGVGDSGGGLQLTVCSLPSRNGGFYWRSGHVHCLAVLGQR